MESVTRQVSSLEPAVRQAMEAVVGHSLQANQQIVEILDAEPAANEAANQPRTSGVPTPNEDENVHLRAEVLAKLPSVEQLDEFAMYRPREWLEDKTWSDGTI